MDGFKNTTKTQYSMGGYATGGSAKFGKVMREFKAGTLHSGSKKGPAVTNPKQAFAIAASEARKAPMKKADGGPVSRKTGTRTDPEYGDFVAAGAAKPSAMAVKRAASPVTSAKKPLSRAMFGDEAAAAMNRAGMGAMTDAEMRLIGKVAAKERAGVGSRTAAEMARSGMGAMTDAEMRLIGKAAMTAAEKREGYNMGGKVMRMAEEDYGYKKGGRAKGSKGPKVMAEKMVATKRTATPTMNAQEMRTMQRYRAAMASRPRREPMIGGDMGGDQIGPAIRQMAMAPEAPPTMGMRKGGYSGMKMRKGGTPC
jgi:hypothetical protein